MDQTSQTKSAKQALERICSGLEEEPTFYYHPSFVDHVNYLEFRGISGVHQSIVLYTKMFSDFQITVKEQMTENKRTTSRFVVTGKCFGQQVRFNGITVSRFEDGLIIEDWSVTDTFGMLCQLGFWRSILLGVKTILPWNRVSKAQ